jgi:hypothetical protein
MARQQSIEDEMKALEDAMKSITKPILDTLNWVVPVVVIGFLGMGYFYVYLKGRK